MATAGESRGAGPERAFADPLVETGEVVLSREESHHLIRARRVAPGARVVLFDGRGGSREGRVVNADPRAARITVTGPYPDREPRREIRIAVSTPEAGRARAMVSGLALLGVSELLPLRCARTQRGAAEIARRQRAQWERLAREAGKVNGRSRLLRILAQEDLPTLLGRAGPPARAVVLEPDPSAASLVEAIPTEGPLPWLLVGPEGGFTEDELAAAQDAGATTASLGATVLRTDGAALAAAAVAAALA